MSKTILHLANTRGNVDMGWLKSFHTFSFGGYIIRKDEFWGITRLTNDSVAGGKGFGEHPHDNMEIISIPLEGGLKHKDNMNNQAVISDGDIQVMKRRNRHISQRAK